MVYKFHDQIMHLLLDAIKVLDLVDMHNYAITFTPIFILFLYDLINYNHYLFIRLFAFFSLI